MTQNIEVSIADVLLRLEAKIDKLSSEVGELRAEISGLKGEVSGLNKRVENLEFIARTVGGGIIVALLLGLSKLLFPNFGI